MKKKLFFIVATWLLLSSTAKADTTWGIGIGPLYSGLGLNFGKITPSSFTYGSLGCKGLTFGKSTDSEKDENESNCGFGFGYISTSLFASDRHGLGLNLGVTYNTDKSQTEVRLRPGYHYFLNGISQRGVNLGVGAILYYDTDESNDLDSDSEKVFINIGYQF